MFLQSPPFVLGIGMVQANLFTWPYYFFPSSALKHGANRSVFVVVTRTLTMLISGYACAPLMAWHRNYKARVGNPTTTSEFAWRSLISLCASSIPFGFAYQLSQWTYEIYFHGVFQCRFPFHSCGDYTLWTWVGYCFFFTMIVLVMVPESKESSHRMHRLSQVYCDTLMKLDKKTIQFEMVSTELYATAGAITIGWGYTNLAAAECDGDYTPSCPDNHSLKANITYALTVVVFFAVTSWGFHSFISRFRFKARANLVAAVEAGQAHELFQEIDKDSDGMITKKELTTFLYQSGLDGEIFEEAFDKLNTGNADGVQAQALLQQFVKLVNTHNVSKSGGEPREMQAASTFNANPLTSQLSKPKQDTYIADEVSHLGAEGEHVLEL